MIAQPLRGARTFQGSDDPAPDEAVAAEERFLVIVRRRVAWQAEAAARLRGHAVAAQGPSVDVLQLATLERLVAARAELPRAAEWRAFLDELEFLVDQDGRLPDSLERLVRVVLAELLEP